uniref:Uncharacterized protein n=1 Tax=Meloidogyne javanica TaxID=6303 RepID=A0A915LVG7_MELJA
MKGSVEALNESSPMEIGDEDSLSLSRPYSPSQVFMSSPEPMEEDEQLNICVSSKEKEELKKEEGENIKNKSENEKIICEEDKKIKEKSEQSIDNIAGIEGGEMPMDISVSSADVSFSFLFFLLSLKEFSKIPEKYIWKDSFLKIYFDNIRP